MMRGKLIARARFGLAVGLSILGLGTAHAAPAWQPIAPENLLVIDSTKGRIIVELRPDMAPAHVARVQRLTREGFDVQTRIAAGIPGPHVHPGRVRVDPLIEVFSLEVVDRTGQLHGLGL